MVTSGERNEGGAEEIYTAGGESEIVTKLFVVVQSNSYPTLYNCMDSGNPGFPVLHYLPEFAQIHLH